MDTINLLFKLNKKSFCLIMFSIFNLILFQTALSQEKPLNGAEIEDQEQSNFGKPIRPVQNSTFYPEEDPDSGMDKCLVADFRYLALNTSDPIKRMQKAEDWVRNNSKYCNIAKLVSIRNNRAQWLGTADSATIDAELGRQLEIAGDSSLEMQAALYGLKLPPPDEEEENE
jgi:hypothetical protein